MVRLDVSFRREFEGRLVGAGPAVGICERGESARRGTKPTDNDLNHNTSNLKQQLRAHVSEGNGVWMGEREQRGLDIKGARISRRHVSVSFSQ